MWGVAGVIVKVSKFVVIMAFISDIVILMQNWSIYCSFEQRDNCSSKDA